MKRLKIPRLFNPKKMLAATARRASAASAGMDFEGIPEPNMKLSRALLIVLVLHVVAVSGIIAFNAIKTRQNSSPPPVRTASSSNLPATSAVKPDTATPHLVATGPKEAARHDEIKPSHSPPKQVAAKDEHKAEHIKSSTPAFGD